jgi:hypothetical protein
LLRENGYTDAFDSPADAEADPGRRSPEVLTAEKLVACLAERKNN